MNGGGATAIRIAKGTGMLAEQFMDRLEKRGMLDAEVVAELRRQLSQMDSKVTPEAIAKLLVEKGHLTKFQATKLVGEVTAPVENVREARAQSKQKKKKGQHSGNELGLAPDVESEEEIVTLEISPAENRALNVPTPTPAPTLTPLGPAPGYTPHGGGLTPIAGGLTPLGPGGGLTAMPYSGGGLQAVNDPRAAGYMGVDSHGGLVPVQPTSVAAPVKIKESRWGSKLIIGGIGVLLLMLLALAALLKWYISGDADERFKMAHEQYSTGSYPTAIKLFDQYLASHPGHKDASRARVLRAFSEIRLATEGSSVPKNGLEVSEKLLPTISQEEAFPDEREDLLALLPEMALKFSVRGRESNATEEKQEMVTLAEQALKLVNSAEYIPSSARGQVGTTLNTVDENLRIARHGIERESQLVQTLAKIDTSISAGDTRQAFQLRKQLLSAHPGLELDKRMVEKTLQISDRERTLVKVVEQLLPGETTDARAEAMVRVPLANRQGDTAANVGDQEVTFVLANGGAYGLRAKNGEPLWQRAVGLETRFHPVPIGPEPGADAIVVDGRNHELLRLEAQTGKLVWRTVIGEPFNPPIVSRGKIVLTTESGRLMQVDPATGNVDRFAQFPIRLTTGPAFDEVRPFYQLGEHSNLYVVSSSTLECDEVVYLGHKEGSVSVAPVVAVGMLFIAENRSKETWLHIFHSDAAGKLKTAQDAIRLDGNVVVPPIVFKRQILFVTDRRAIYLYRIEPTADPPVAPAAQEVSSANQAVTGYPYLTETGLWLADNRLSRYEIQQTTSKILPKGTVFSGDAFLAPLQMFGKVMIHTRRPANGGGAIVAATDVDNVNRTVWTVQLGDPVQKVSWNSDRVMAVSSGGALYELRPEQLRTRGVGQPAERATPDPLAFNHALGLKDGSAAFFSDFHRERALVFDPTRPSDRLRIVNLKIGRGSATCDPLFFAGGLLVPLDSGEIMLFDLASGENRAYPFLPPMEPGSRIHWSRPAVVKNDREFVIGNSRRELLRIMVKSGAKPFLAEARKVVLEADLGERVAALADTVFVVLRNTTGDSLAALNTSDLKPRQEPVPIDGRVDWGPETIGDMVLVVADSEQLCCFDADGKQRWRVPLAHGPLAGLPLLVNGELVCASLDGVVWRMAGATGEELGTADVGEPLDSGPVAFADGLVLAAADGSLRVVSVP